MHGPDQDSGAVVTVADVIGGSPVAAAAMDAAGHITAWNEAANRLFGHDADRAVGAHLADLVALPAQRAGGFLAWQQLSQDDPTTRFSTMSVMTTHRDGTAIPVQLTVSGLGDGTGIAWFRPVADVAPPPPSDDLFREIFDRAPEAITILEPDGRQRTVNPAGLALVGLVPGMEQVGDGGVYVHPDDQALLEERASRRRDGRPLPSDPVRYRVSHADGSWRWLESLSVDLRDVPPVSGILVLSRDVTGSEEQRQALEAATARLDQLDRSRSSVLSAVSHELRTPLAAIRSASEHLATDDVDAEEVRAYAELIHRNSARLEAMVSDLLLIGRVQSGTLPVEPEAVDVAAVVQHVVAAHRDPAGPAVAVRVPAGPPALADAQRLSQVVGNLVANAVKFGGGHDVEVAGTCERGHWVLTVSDRGPGIDPEEADRIFDPFYRGRATARSTPGSGVGLSIARGIVELSGGTLELRPRPGGGTEAVVTVPTAPEQAHRGR